ncbi:hypothetical protein LguiA_023666 [Lonicera macranthoides]
MEDSEHMLTSPKSLDPRVSTRRKLSISCIVATAPKNFSQQTLKCITSVKQSIKENKTVGEIGLFLLTTAALEVVRRLSRSKCPFVWRGIQALQLLCFPPFRWIQRWAPFKGLVKSMQALSRPLLVLSIATVFSDESACTKRKGNRFDDSQAYSELQSETSTELSALDTRSANKVPKDLATEKWLLELCEELDRQGLSLPERFDEDELRRFYSASNFEFSRLLSSVKKTILWRQTYTILSFKELEAWSHWIFWHGCDTRRRPCLIIRLGLACSSLKSNEKALLARAVVSQIEHGIVNLVDAAHPQITVLMDCEGLSPLGFPLQTMRTCAILLQDHYPRRLGCLMVIRLPAVAKFITKALFQVLKPATRKKLRIVEGNYQEVLSKCLQALPLFLGGICSCSKCSGLGGTQGLTNVRVPSQDFYASTGPGENYSTTLSPESYAATENYSNAPPLDSDIQSRGSENGVIVRSPDIYQHHTGTSGKREQVIWAAIVGILVFWMFMAIVRKAYP